jgi:hypothetical protein
MPNGALAATAGNIPRVVRCGFAEVQMETRAIRSAGLAWLVLGAFTGCVGQVDPVGDDSTPQDTANLDLSGYKSAGQVLCDIVSHIPSFTVGDVSISSQGCQTQQYDNFYYFGSDYWTPRIAGIGGSTNPQRSYATATALYCALKDSNGAKADATVSTSLGRFGMLTHINVAKSDPTAMQVVGQRLGTLYAFGVGLDLEDQDYVAQFPHENQARSCTGFICPIGGETGYYMDLQTSTAKWGLGGSGALGPFTLSVSFGQNPYFASMNNDAFAWSPASQQNAPNPGLTWSAWEQSCGSCVPSGLIQCDCPNSAQIAAHNQFASWTGAQYRNLTDGVLPYVGDTGGVSGNQVYLNPTLNWTQLGPSKGGLIAAVPALGGLPGTAGDPTHDAKDNPSTEFNVNFGFNYDIVDLSLNLKLGFLSAMELTQSQGGGADTVRYASVQNEIDAANSVNVTANLVVENPFPFGPNPLINATFDLVDQGNQASTIAATVEYDYANGLPVYDYQTAATGYANPSTAFTTCTTAPVVNNAPVTPGSPQTWVQNVGTAAQKQLYPCNVKLCQPNGTLEICNWSASVNKMVCNQTSTLCSPCADSAQLCDASGKVYSPVSTTNYYSQCQIQ